MHADPNLHKYLPEVEKILQSGSTSNALDALQQAIENDPNFQPQGGHSTPQDYAKAVTDQFRALPKFRLSAQRSMIPGTDEYAQNVHQQLQSVDVTSSQLGQTDPQKQQAYNDKFFNIINELQNERHVGTNIGQILRRYMDQVKKPMGEIGTTRESLASIIKDVTNDSALAKKYGDMEVGSGPDTLESLSKSFYRMNTDNDLAVMLNRMYGYGVRQSIDKMSKAKR